MSAPDLTTATMAQFRESGAEKHTTILLGAGASTSSGLPDWDDLAIRLLVRSGSVVAEDAARLLVTRQDPLLVAEAARAASGDRWEDLLRRALYDGTEELDPSPLHLAAVGHLLAGSREDTRLVTLNFDTLLEQAITAESGRSAEPRTDASRSMRGHVVHHLHGVITPGRADRVVLTLSDFTTLVGEPEPWQLDYLRSAIADGALLIAGTSYRDPDLRQWLHVALADQPNDHAAMVLLAREGYGLTKEQFAKVQRALTDQWQAVGMRPVLLQDFSDAAQIIRELRHVHLSTYSSPQERATTIWRTHVDLFDDLQRTYSDRLHADAATLREALDVHLNLTLWIATGDGRLGRWASQDRYQRHIDDVRLVQSGHDSPWIAGRTLGADALLFQDLDGDRTRRWRSVLSAPVPVAHPQWPAFSTAVLSIGLPRPADAYLSTGPQWSDALSAIVDAWSTRLALTSFGYDARYH